MRAFRQAGRHDLAYQQLKALGGAVAAAGRFQLNKECKWCQQVETTEHGLLLCPAIAEKS
jgi:hypothetical protein